MHGLLVDDTRTGVLYAVTPDGEPETLLILTPTSSGGEHP
jgi:hypothetical protein